jgi:Glycosyltransferase family 9 (heptosyltransferase)
MPWEAVETAGLFTEAGASGLFRDRLAAFDAATAYTWSPDLARNLRAVIPRVLVHDPLPPAGSGHAAQWLARPIASLGVPCGHDEPPTLEGTNEERAQAAALVRELPERFLAIHPGSGSPSKTWPADRFSRLLDVLRVEPFLLVEGPADAEAAAVLRAGGRAITARGLTPRNLGAALARAAAYVGNDSGVTHLAAAWGAPTVALFGPTDPEVWAPTGPQARVVRAPDGRMDGLAVEAVLGAVAPLLAGDPRGAR